MAIFNAVEEAEEKQFFERVEISQVSEDTNGFQVIKNLAVSPSERNLLATTDKQQLYTSRMPTVIREGEAVDDDAQGTGLQLLVAANHHGAVTDISIALRKPLAATCSSDGSIRVWDYTTDKLELKKYFQESGHSISMHPSGLHLLVGFSDKLRLLNILMDDIRTFHEFNSAFAPLHHILSWSAVCSLCECATCRLSNGGLACSLCSACSTTTS
jgi:WD40 repeat protein